jgi:hypothetical protein
MTKKIDSTAMSAAKSKRAPLRLVDKRTPPRRDLRLGEIEDWTIWMQGHVDQAKAILECTSLAMKHDADSVEADVAIDGVVEMLKDLHKDICKLTRQCSDGVRDDDAAE